MEMVTTSGLSKKFGPLYAVNDVTLNIENGKIYGLLGPNGSGKTTLMRLIAGLYYKDSGNITVMGETLSYQSKASVAYMPTESFFYDYMAIKDVQEFFTDFFEDFDNEKFESILGDMGLDRSMKITSLSSGMNAKLRVALTMARQAKIYLLDEPLNGIDLVARDSILNAIIGGASDENAIIISSHLIDVMENILDDVIFLKEGRVVISGNAEDVREANKKSIVDMYREVFAI